MRMQIQVTKMIRIHAYPDPDADPDLQHWFRKNLNWNEPNCAADFSLLNLPKGRSLGRRKPATSSYAQALQHTVRDNFYYIQALLNCLL